jgi:HD-GYP domain-containing protein (c-di-GMP phosphodiesterase class II)
MANSKKNITENIGDLTAIYKFVTGIIEERYPDLAAHLIRMKDQVATFAQYASLTDEETNLLSIGAGIHDIGKLSISDYILNKPAKLTSCEYSLVKRHVEFGFKFLEPLNLDTRINEIVLYHHENYDGSGYPDGLAGDEIPLLARMTRILDSHDALTEHRPYHKGISNHEALKLMHSESHCYDPHLLQCFSEMINSMEVAATKFQNPYELSSVGN